MRVLILIGLLGCSEPDMRELPGATLVPHGSRTPLVAGACGVDVTFGGFSTTTVRYRYTYNELAQVIRITGRFEDAGPDDAIDLAYDDAGRITSTIETRGEGYDRREERTVYDADAVATFTLDQSGPGYHDLTSYTFEGNATAVTIALPDEPARAFTLAYDASDRLAAAIRDDGRTTTYTYAETDHTVTIDTGEGAIVGEIHYDADNRELAETWGGTDPAADHRDAVYAYDRDRLASITFRAGEPLAPVEVVLPRYACD